MNETHIKQKGKWVYLYRARARRDVAVAAEFKQPFDIIAKTKVKIESEVAADASKMAIFVKWLPETDSNR